VKNALECLASLRLTLFLICGLALGVVLAYRGNVSSSLAVIPPLGLLAANLLAAIATRPLFRVNAPLLVFHVALLVLIGLLAFGRLTYLKGAAEVTTGTALDGTLVHLEAGPWHDHAYREVTFTNEGFDIEYKPGISRDRTYNSVSWQDTSGNQRRAVIGDHTPLVLDGYRFYTSFNKGFAPLFTWQPVEGDAVRGSVHLPSYPLNEYSQANSWSVPGVGEPFWVQLEFTDLVLDPARYSNFRVPRDPRVVIRTEEQRVVLLPGQSAELISGRLTFEGVTTWMGYTVFYDPTPPWLLATCLVAVVSLGWYFVDKYRRVPWAQEGERMRSSATRDA